MAQLAPACAGHTLRLSCAPTRASAINRLLKNEPTRSFLFFRLPPKRATDFLLAYPLRYIPTTSSYRSTRRWLWRECEAWWHAGQYAAELEAAAIIRTRPLSCCTTEFSLRQAASGRRACTWLEREAIHLEMSEHFYRSMFGVIWTDQPCTEIAGEPKSGARTHGGKHPRVHCACATEVHFGLRSLASHWHGDYSTACVWTSMKSTARSPGCNLRLKRPSASTSNPNFFSTACAGALRGVFLKFTSSRATGLMLWFTR